MDYLEKVSSRVQPKYVTLEWCFILMQLYWMISGFEFLILSLLPDKFNFLLSSPKWIRNLLSTNWLVWLNGWVFVYKLSGCGFESCCCHLNLIQANYRVWIPSEIHTWHDNNIQSIISVFIFVYCGRTFFEFIWLIIVENKTLFWRNLILKSP